MPDPNINQKDRKKENKTCNEASNDRGTQDQAAGVSALAISTKSLSNSVALNV
jgi:hypothetical protein